jgi:DNA polymerase III delta prime subunit
MNPEPLYLGLKLYELLTLIGIVASPIVAVCVTLVTEARRRTKEQQTQTLRMLLSTRHLPGDAAYSTAINLIPVDFNSEPEVMKAWENYIEVIRFRPQPEDEVTHRSKIITMQTKLIFQIMKSLGYKLDETDIQSSAYAADGFIVRDNLNLDAMRAWSRIADALESQNAALLNYLDAPHADDKK